MPKLRTVTTKQIKKAAMKYFKAGKLTAQHPDRRARRCQIQVTTKAGEFRCAIGAVMTPKEIAKMGRGELGGVDSLVGMIMDFEDTNEAAEIQGAHDSWASQSSVNGVKSDGAIFAKNKFLEMIKMD